MKKNLLLMVMILFCATAYAQNKFNLADVKSLTFYGIDFSIAKVYGGKETAHQYWTTYADINELFIDKPKTFSIEKRLGIPVDVISLEAVNQVNKKINPDSIKIDVSTYMPTGEQITEAVKNLPILSQEEKTGLVIVALFLNKADNRGTISLLSSTPKPVKSLNNGPTPEPVWVIT